MIKLLVATTHMPGTLSTGWFHWHRGAASGYLRVFDRDTTNFVVKKTYRHKYNRYAVTDGNYDNTMYDVNNTLKLRT